jgi:F-type H+-transporting ATPase subunit b
MAAQVTGFVLLWIILARYLFRPILALLNAREEEIKLSYENAETERAKAEEFREEYEKRLAGIEAEARARIQSAVREAEAARDQIVSEARGRSEDILRRGAEELAREREKTLAQIRTEVVDISLAAAGKIIGESMDDQKHRKLVNEFVDKIGAVE